MIIKRFIEKINISLNKLLNRYLRKNIILNGNFNFFLREISSLIKIKSKFETLFHENYREWESDICLRANKKSP